MPPALIIHASSIDHPLNLWFHTVFFKLSCNHFSIGHSMLVRCSESVWSIHVCHTIGADLLPRASGNTRPHKAPCAAPTTVLACIHTCRQNTRNRRRAGKQTWKMETSPGQHVWGATLASSKMLMTKRQKHLITDKAPAEYT